MILVCLLIWRHVGPHLSVTMVVMVGSAIIVCWYIMIATSLWDIYYDDSEFKYTSPLGKKTAIPYQQVTQVVQRKYSVQIWVGKKKYDVERTTIGLAEFAQVFEGKTGRPLIGQYNVGKVNWGVSNVIIGVFIFAGSLAMVTLIVQDAGRAATLMDWRAILLIFGSLSFIGIYLAFNAFLWCITYTETDFTYRSTWRRSVTVPYSNLVRIRRGSYYLHLYTEKRHFKVARQTDGYDEFRRAIKRNASDVWQ